MRILQRSKACFSMRKLFVIFLSLFFSFGYCQDYSLIRRAEKKINAKEYKKALRLLNRAEHADYGFCGNARMEAVSEINRLHLRLYKETNDLENLARFLNKIDLEFDTFYSKERIYLALHYFTKEELHLSILGEMAHVENKFFDTTINLKIKKDYILKLQFNYYDIISKAESEKISFSDALIKIYETSEYRALLN